MNLEILRNITGTGYLEELTLVLVPILSYLFTRKVSKRRVNKSVIQQVLLPVIVFFIRVLLRAIRDKEIKEHVNSINHDLKSLRRRVKAPRARG